MIVGRTVLRYSPPVHRFRSKVRLPEASDRIVIPPFRVGKSLPNKSYATETIHQSGHEIAIRQIAFQSHTLLAGSIEQEHSRCPDRIEAVELCRLLFNNTMRINLFGSQGPADNHHAITWHPPMSKTFHVPERFGIIKLTR